MVVDQGFDFSQRGAGPESRLQNAKKMTVHEFDYGI